MATISNLLVRFGRRQLHTIISKEIIKPFSPTPSHLNTYNLTVHDQLITHNFMSIVTFYPNTGLYQSPFHDKTVALKNSLSHTLTRYYPFAGRYDKVAPAYVDCNDNGAEFFEASIDKTLSNFLQNSKHEDLNQFCPHGLSHDLQSEKVIPLKVQINHFECGGVAVAVSMSHKIADGYSLARFIDDWAIMTRFCSRDQKQEFPIDPKFISFQYKNMNSNGLSFKRSKDCVTRSFIFPNSKINDLKLKVKAMTEESGQPIMNLTRVEVLVWLLYKCAVAAATKNNSGSFKPTSVYQPINIRGKMIESLPEMSIGNFFEVMEIPTKNESEMNPALFISEVKKQKMRFQGLKNIETALNLYSNVDLKEMQRNCDSGYTFTSLCGYPIYEIDFGWGKPVKTTIPGFTDKNFVFLIDAPNQDGIEALVTLRKQDMAIFQGDPDLVDFI